MDQGDQQQIWTRRSFSTTVEMVLDGYHTPHAFQAEFADYMNRLGESLRSPTPVKVCELGCEFGVTTLLLSGKTFERHALDVNPHALELLSQAALKLGQTVEVHAGDMFNTGWPEAKFDVVFSNGVLEHYDLPDRSAALKEAARVTRRGGVVVVGVPNHCSLPYRCTYLLRRITGHWHYPPENKICDFAAELAQVSALQSARTLFFDQETTFAVLPNSRITSFPFRMLHHWLKLQPYLRVFELSRV